MPKVDEVFGIRSGPILSYTIRENVDGKFKAALETDHHILVYGSSKQGKSSLRERYIVSDNCVVVRAAPNMTTKNIYNAILRQADVKIETVETTDTTVGGSVRTKIGFKAMVPWLGAAKSETEIEGKADRQLSLSKDFISFDFDEAQSVGELLHAVGFKKFIVVENFHYLPQDVQTRLAFDLKTFHEIKLRFVILGIWKEANHLLVYNGDLEDRLVEVPVEPWTEADFRFVAKRGSDALNLQIDGSDIEAFIANSYGNIGMFQEFLKAYCVAFGVKETVAGKLSVGPSPQILAQTFSQRLESQRAQFSKMLQTISSRSRVRSDEGDPLLLPYYLARVICRLPVPELQAGINKNRILELLRNIHHREDKETIRTGDVTNLMQRLPSIQRDTHPPLLYYDGTARLLRFVDTRHFFVLANCDRKELEDDIPFPREGGDDE